MKKKIYFFKILYFIIATMCFVSSKAQLNITPITNQSIKNILETYFLGDGVKIDTTRPIYYNNQVVINNNQIGIFTNVDTSYSGKNIPIKSGLILATTACKNIVSGNEIIQNAVSGAGTYAPSLYSSYQKFVNDPTINKYGCTLTGDDGKFNDIAVLDFWVIPQSCSMSFKYCFGSQEYPDYVCTSFNDFFGLYCDGPYDENFNPYNQGNTFYSNPTNIAIIPGTYDEDDFQSGQSVMINTINNGNTSKTCGVDNEGLFIDNRDKKCNTTILGGYTKRLETAVLQTVPGKKYHVQIAICNIDDHSFQSAVFLESNSFVAENISIKHSMTKTPKDDGYKLIKNADNKYEYVYIKGCSSDTMILSANYVAKANEDPYTFFVKPTAGSNIVRGQDYDYFLIKKDGTVETLPANNVVEMPEGDTMMRFLLTFMHNDNVEKGKIDTLLFISTDCKNDPVDTIYYLMQEPLPLEVSVNGGLTLCYDKLPVKDSITVQIKNSVSFAYVKAICNSKIIHSDTMRADIYAKDTVFIKKIPVDIMNIDNPSSVSIYVEDFCGRTFDTIINYKVIISSTKATLSKDYICEGDSVTLNCTDAATYVWTASPRDLTLIADENARIQNPTVTPQQNTTYKVVATSPEGCVSSDSVKVRVEMIVKAEMELKPKKVYYSNPEIAYKDLSKGAFERKWYFGDGTSSDVIEGYHSYETDTSEDSHTFPVTLIVYNKAMCPDTLVDSVQVVVDFTMWLPNAFTPGYNDGTINIFGPKGKFLTDYELFIFNRWGTKVFQIKNGSWDGKLEDGQTAPQGTYVYVILYKDGRGLPQRKSGTFTLIPADGHR